MADVEQRILEMKLDSSDLERNAESSIKTIQKLNSAMKFDDATRGFADLDKSVKNVNLDSLNKSIKGIDFNPLNASLQASANYLVSFGTTFKRVMYEEISRPIAQLPMKVANFAVKPLKLLGAAFDTIATKGKARATNIDQANFMLEGLGANIEEVGEAVSASVNGTAFGYDEAAKVASSFYATGIEDAKQMEEYLKGVVGVAAMTNSDLGSIGHIFTTIAGQGKVTREQLNQFAVKGLNVSADLAKELGKSEEEISKMISKGMIDFDTFATIMNKRYAEHAFKANETYEGSLANMKSALGRIGADFFAPMRDMMIPIFNRLKDIFNNIKQTMKDKGIYDGFTRLTENVTKLFTTIFGAPDSTDFWFLSWVDTLAEKASQAIDFVNGLIESAIGFFEPILGVGKEAAEVAETVTETVQDIDAMANRVIAGEFGNDQERFDQLEKLGYNYKIVQNRVNELLGCSYRYEVTEEEMAAATEKNAEAQEKQATFMSKATEAQTKLQETAKGVVKQTRDYIKTIDKKSVFQKFQTALTGIGSLFSIVGSTVGAIVKGAWGGLLEAFKTIGGWILNAAAALGEWITKLETWMKENKVFESMQNGINKAMTKFNSALKTVGKVGGTAFDVLKAGGSKVSTLFTQAKTNASAFWEEFKQTSAYQRLSDIIEGIKQKFIELKDAGIQKVLDLIERFKGTEVKLPEFNAGSFAEAVSEKINWLLDRLTDVKTTIKNLFSGAGEGGATIGSSIKEFFESETLQSGISTVTDLLGKAKDAILDFFNIFAGNTIEGAENASDSAVKVFDNFAASAKALKGDVAEDGKTKLQEFMTWINDVTPTIRELGKLVGKALGIFTAFKSLKAIWGVLGWFENINGILKQVKGSLRQVKGILRAVKLTIKSVSKIGKAYARDLNAKALLKVSAAVGIFAASLFLLGQLSWDQLKVAAAGIAIITGALAVLIGVLRLSGAFGGKGKGGGGYAEKLGEFLAGIKEGVNKFLKKAGTAMMFGAFAAAIAILAHTLKTIGDMKWEQIAKGLAGILGCMMVLMAAMAIMAGITKVMGKDKFSVKQAIIMIALAGTIMLLGIAVKKLGKLGTSQLTKGLVAVGVISFVLGAMMELSKNTKGAKVGPILSMALAIGVIAGAVIVLSDIPADKLAGATTVMAVLMGVFAGMMVAAGQMKGGGAGMIAGIVLMGLVLGEIAAVLYMFTKDDSLDPDKMLKISGAMSVMMIAFGAITKLCQYIGSSGMAGIVNAAVGALEVAGITGLIFLLGDMIGCFVGEMFSEENIALAETGIQRVGRIITAITTVFGDAIGGFVSGLVSTSMEGIAESLPGIGEKLSEFVSNLGTLATGDGPSFKGFSNLMGFISDLVDMAGDNTMNDILTSWFFDENSSITRLGTELNTFAGQMQTYAGKIKGVDEETVTSTSRAIQTVVDYAAAVPETGGLLDMLMGGDSSLTTFGQQAHTFALWMVKYSEVISGMNIGSTIATSAAIQSVMAYANATPDIHDGGTLLGQIIGDNSLTALAEGLVPFASAMVAYSWIVSQLNSSAVEQSSKAVSIITEFANNIPNIRLVNTVAGQFFGSNSFEALGAGLKTFGQAMVDYSKVVGGEELDTTAITNSETAAKMLIALAEAAPSIHDSETFMGWLAGDNSLATLGTNITSFGDSMVLFAQSLSKIENMSAVEGMIGQITGILSTFGELSDNFNGYDAERVGIAINDIEKQTEALFADFSNMFNDEKNVETLKTSGISLWERVVEGFKEAASGGGEEGNLSTILSNIAFSGGEGESSPLFETGKSMGEQLVLGIRNFFETDTIFSGTDIPAFVLTALESMKNTLSILGPSTVTPGMQTVMRALGNAITFYGPILQAKVRSVCYQMKNVVKEYVDDFEALGKDLVKGLANGMTKNVHLAKAAAERVVSDAIKAGKAAAASNSPSKKTMELGEFMTEGLAIGMTNKLYMATASAAQVSSSVIDSMEQSFGDLNDAAEHTGMEILNNLTSVYQYVGSVIESAMDVDPRITPVMDLSNIQNGVGTINSMLGGSMYGLGGLSYARSMYPGTYTNPALNAMGTGNDMFSVVQGIRTDLNTLGQAMSNMQMVMDSGALVGSISGGVDKELGSYQKLKERWA